MATDDKRHFSRYRKGSDFSVKLNDAHYRAKLTDYSPDGLGLIIEKGPEIVDGDMIDISLTSAPCFFPRP
jgi:hypothetical protein